MQTKFFRLFSPFRGLMYHECKQMFYWNSNGFHSQVGIIGGSGLDDPELLDDRREIYRETPYGMCWNGEWFANRFQVPDQALFSYLNLLSTSSSYSFSSLAASAIFSSSFILYIVNRMVSGAPSDVLVEGKISGVDCVLLARHGRKHSIMPSNVNYRANIWALKNVGCTHVIVSTATGSLQEDIKPGDIVIIDNFIDRTTKRNQTFYDGTVTSPFGVCHLPMEPAFCERSRDVIIQTACDLGKLGRFWIRPAICRFLRTMICCVCSFYWNRCV